MDLDVTCFCNLMSTFVNHLVEDLATKAVPNSVVVDTDAPAINAAQKDALRSVLISLNPPTSPQAVRDAFKSLGNSFTETSLSVDKEEDALKSAVLGRIMVGVYAEALTMYLGEATEAESEAEWWDNIERSQRNLALYLLQTLPVRLLELSRTIVRTLHDKNIPVNLSAFSPASLRQLFPSTNDMFRSNALTIALFPHLRQQPHILALSSSTRRPSISRPRVTRIQSMINIIGDWTSFLFSIVTLPVELARQECRLKRVELEKLRDERAEVLGALSDMRGSFDSLLTNQLSSQNASFQTDPYVLPVNNLHAKLARDASSPSLPLEALHSLAFQVLPGNRQANRTFLQNYSLLRPSWLTLAWPKLLILPPLVLYGCKMAYASRASLEEMVMDTWSTIEGFWTGWLIDPLKDIVKTVRAGGEDGVIVQKEAIAADLASLERMVLSLAQDKLNYKGEQLAELTTKIRQGDLTSVLELYEQDIKSPVKSAVTGTLLRSLFIQIQKAKVDIDQALSGIDKLLKSQELTFAFVGVAPALAIVYVTAGYLRGIWSGGRGRGVYGGKRQRTRAWVYMRRIERLLTAQPNQKSDNSNITPLTSGLLLLSVTRLRSFAETYLPPSSHIREGFLEDIKDLEDANLGRPEKLRVVDRMWRCWGTSLRWNIDER